MSSPAVVVYLLVVLFPPPEVLTGTPNARPIMQSFEEPDVATCQANAATRAAEIIAANHGAEPYPAIGCVAFPAPDTKPAKPGLQPDGNFLSPDGTITPPGDPL